MTTWLHATQQSTIEEMMLGIHPIGTMNVKKPERRDGCIPTCIPSLPLAYETSAEGTQQAYETADYVRLRICSDSDPFIGIPQEAEWSINQWPTMIENDPFGDLDEELPWLETFTDLNSYEHHDLPVNPSPSPICDDGKKGEIDWIPEWDRFLRENHPVEYELGSGPSSPCCEDYIPNFEVIDSGRQADEIEQEEPLPPARTIPAFVPIEAFPEDFEIIEEFFEIEKPSEEEPKKPKRGRPRLPKPQRTQKTRFSPYSDEEEDDTNPSDNRRRSLNRDAAFRYRERKKALKEAAFIEAQELESRNSWLTSRVSMLTNEIQRMRTHLEDMGALP